MHRLTYRNFGDHEPLLMNHTVDAGSGRAGIRWYEVRDPGGAPAIYQQGTYAPNDSASRWMGSLAMDHTGNIALGYSVSSSSIYPSIRYAGRLVDDPPGEMTQGEDSIVVGAGSQTDPAARWGDYSSMNLDPVDDCTFWYTQEYYPVTIGAQLAYAHCFFSFSELQRWPQRGAAGRRARCRFQQPHRQFAYFDRVRRWASDSGECSVRPVHADRSCEYVHPHRFSLRLYSRSSSGA